MKAILIRTPGDPSVLDLADVERPVPGHRDVVIEVAAAGVNRADISQRLGNYPPPAGAPHWPGLEVSGTIIEIGDEVTRFRLGDAVCALLSGGGYAEFVVVDERLALPVPSNIPLADSAGLMEVAATVWSNVFRAPGLHDNDTLLVHGGSSGIGTMAIQIARALGVRVAVTAGSAEKLEACRHLGAEVLINYREERFEQIVMDRLGGADVVLDPIGGSYLQRNIDVLKTGGRVMNIGNLSGEQGTFDFASLMRRRGSVHATSLRARPFTERASIVAAVEDNVWPMIEEGLVFPVIAARYPLADAAGAHRLMESSAHIGKILLTATSEPA